MHIRAMSQTKLALGGKISLGIVTELSVKEVENLYTELWRHVYNFEKQFSRFLPMSELSIFNRSAGLKTPVSSEFRALLTTAKSLGTKTGGLYNPFILPALQRAGYIASAMVSYENDPQEDYSTKQVVGINQLTVGDYWASIPHGTVLDMGGCGKGYLADQLGRVLQESSVRGYWLSLGGDVATMGYDENGASLTINIQNASQLDSVLNQIITCPAEPAAVATSGTFKRKEQGVGEGWHHIIDPTTLKPAITDIRLATVCAETAVEADVLASCAIILGSRKATGFLKKRGVVAALLQCIDKQGQSFERQFGQRIAPVSLYQPAEIANNA